jgi:hypothetical protein
MKSAPGGLLKMLRRKSGGTIYTNSQNRSDLAIRQGDQMSLQKIAHHVDRPIFCRNYYITKAVGKNGPKCGLLEAFQKNAQRKQITYLAKIRSIWSSWLKNLFLSGWQKMDQFRLFV